MKLLLLLLPLAATASAATFVTTRLPQTSASANGARGDAEDTESNFGFGTSDAAQNMNGFATGRSSSAGYSRTNGDVGAQADASSSWTHHTATSTGQSVTQFTVTSSTLAVGTAITTDIRLHLDGSILANVSNSTGLVADGPGNASGEITYRARIYNFNPYIVHTEFDGFENQSLFEIRLGEGFNKNNNAQNNTSRTSTRILNGATVTVTPLGGDIIPGSLNSFSSNFFEVTQTVAFNAIVGETYFVNQYIQTEALAVGSRFLDGNGETQNRNAVANVDFANTGSFTVNDPSGQADYTVTPLSPVPEPSSLLCCLASTLLMAQRRR